MSNTPKLRLRWYQPTPGRLLVFLLAVEGILHFSERWSWFLFNRHKGYSVLIALAAVGLFLLVMILWFIVSIIFHWWFQFSIRSLLVLTVVVAIPCSWLAVEMKWAREQREAVEALQMMGGGVLYECQCNMKIESDPRNDRNLRLRHTQTFQYLWPWSREPAAPEWLENILGTDFFDRVGIVTLVGPKVTDTDLENVKNIRNLQILRLKDTHVTDAGLDELHKAQPNLFVAQLF